MMQGHSYPESYLSHTNDSIRGQRMVNFTNVSKLDNVMVPDNRSKNTGPPVKEKKHSLECDSGIDSAATAKRQRAGVFQEKFACAETDQGSSGLCDTNALKLDSETVSIQMNEVLKNNLMADKRIHVKANDAADVVSTQTAPKSNSDRPVIEMLDDKSSENECIDNSSQTNSVISPFDEIKSLSRNSSKSLNENLIDSHGIEILAGVIGKLPSMETIETDQPMMLSNESDKLQVKIKGPLRKTDPSDYHHEGWDAVNLEQTKRDCIRKANHHSVTGTVDYVMPKRSTDKDGVSKIFNESLISRTKPIHSTTWLSNLPLLPSEPELNPTMHVNSVSKDHRLPLPHEAPLDVKEPLFISKSLPMSLKTVGSSSFDSWYPSNKSILRERKTQGMMDADKKIVAEVSTPDSTLPISASVHDRLHSSMEPGAIEKLPHCKLYEQMYLAKNDENLREPLFCFQVAELHCQSMMVCCSKCSTWRHVQCGGHFSCSIPRREISLFYPVCDRCHAEELILDKYPLARSRIERQRIIHLRKTQTVGSIIRTAAYAKFGSQNWPPGSIQSSQLTSHKKGMLTRFAKAEKQWNDMLVKLGPQEKTAHKLVALRSKEFERILQYLEDSEIKCNLHNAILFLQRDIQKKYPTGHEKPLFNLFDPEDDSLRISIFKEKHANKDDTNDSSDDESEITGSEDDLETTKEKQSKDLPIVCMRIGCKRSPRFDSHFCTDACGILTMESDLLQTLKQADQLHPSNLRC